MFNHFIFHRIIFVPALFLAFCASALCEDSPFAKFKKIFDLPEAKREAAIQSINISSEKYRAVISSKVKEYEIMPEKERNQKLDILDFRWHLLPLLKMEPEKRAN